ncbi:MAG: response regulator transcription factor, partial [Alicyclobacillaceae bacterium]|nr:response regulator transcription factor [Alicyclobacillaceae bacterium]
EQQILQLIADGLDTKEISKHLHLSEYTVSEYVGTILRKLRATNRSEAVAKALRQHLIH